MNTQFCKCETPDTWSNIYKTFGRPGNIADYQICECCNLPIAGTATTHTNKE